MIIPPDPEKDPRLFTASTSTPSLLLPPASDVDSDIADAGNRAYDYPITGGQEEGQRYSEEFLPPYERRARALATSSAGREMGERERSPGYIGITIPSRPIDGFAPSEGSITPTASTYASASTSRLPQPSSATTTLPPGSSTAKLWESSSSSLRHDQPRSARWKGKSRALFGLPVKTERDPLGPARSQRWWKKWKRWVLAASVVGLLGIGLMIGLLTGLPKPYWRDEDRIVQSGPAWHDVEPGDSRWNMAWADGSMNLTWTHGRDSPPSSDGTPVDCNTFTPFNTSDPTTNFTTLSTSYPSNKLWVSTYVIPLQRIDMTISPYSIIPPDNSTNSTNPTNPIYRPKNYTAPPKLSSFPLGLLTQLPIVSRGLASSGTVEFVGREAAPEVISGGIEDSIRIDVVVQYGGAQDVNGLMRVCELAKDGITGVGVYTPVLTDGKMSNPYTLDPTQLPSYHIIVRFPPSLFKTPDSSPPLKPIYVADMMMRLDKMGVRVGDLGGVVEFGTWNVTSDRGGAVVGYVAAERVWVQTAENAVRGRFNVSKSLYINSTDSSIMADIILHDPSSSLNTSLPRSSVASRGLSSNDTAATYLANTTASVITHNFTHTVNTTFHTTDGLIRIKYISHPPQTALSSWTSLSSGEMDVSVHPNYIGPFAVKNAWGSVRLPTPRERIYDDPVGSGRRRAVVLGGIKIVDGSLFQRGGLNETLLPMSGTTITGAAYWQEGTNGTLTPQAVQVGEEGKRGSQMVLLGGWGDVTLRFDGT